MSKRIAVTLAALALPLAAAPFVAAAQSDDDMAKQMINDPNPSTFQVVGVTPAPHSVKDASVQGGRSISIPVTGNGNPWDGSVNVPIIKPVHAGDHIEMMFYAKLAKADGGATTAKIAAAQLQLAQAPYTLVFGEPVEVTPEWKLFDVKGVADKEYAANQLNAAFHLNTGRQTIAMGLVAIFDHGR